ncbi:MAG TPA: type II secretion system secretin GspD, partial [Dongiaceae bacterium]|nr:type II secretion system secretin GspD [Dongiaceae bacterium]
SNTEMSADDIYNMFESVLRVHGFASVKAGSVVKIVPNQSAKQEDLPLTDKGDPSERMVTRVIPVLNTNATELVPILRPMVPQYGHLAAVASANALIISDHASNIERMIQIVKRVDSAESEDVEVIQLKNAWVGDVVKTLEQLTPVDTGAANKRPGAAGGSPAAKVRVVAEERTNRLILRGEKTARMRVKALLVDLDKPADNTGSTSVIYLRHAEAVKVAEILRGLITGQVASTGSSRSSSSRSSSSTSGSGASGMSGSSSTSRPSPSMSSMSSGSGDTGDVNIQADETLNALIVKAGPSDLAEIKTIVAQLDVRRAQVLIEAAFVEISGDTSEAVGVQWGYGDTDNGLAGTNFNVGGMTPLSSIVTAVRGDGDSESDTPLSLPSGLALAGADIGSDGKVRFAAVIQALEGNSSSNLLSTPSIMTMDNEEAEIIVGENVPFVTGSTSGSNNENPFTTIERKDVGLTLKVTPQINDGEVIRLQLEQEVSAVKTTATEGAQDLVTTKRSVKSVILANDGQVIVTGGLIADDVSNAMQKVPMLGDIPLVGALFRAKSNRLQKRNLLLFLQPTIIRNSEKAQQVTDRRYDHIRQVSLGVDEDGKLRKLEDSLYPENPTQLIQKGIESKQAHDSADDEQP